MLTDEVAVGTGPAADEAGALLAEHRYADARSLFEKLLEDGDDPDVLAGLALACRGLDDVPAAQRALERAHRLHVEAGNDSAAALTACTLADLQLTHLGASSVASGWLARARNHLRDLPDDATHVPVEGQLAYLALAYDKDPVRAREHAERSLSHAVRLGDTAAEMLGKGYLGLIQVSLGEVGTGMALLDEAAAAASAGELSTTDGLDTYCLLLTACERVRDFTRVEEWAQHVLSVATEVGGDGFATFARTQYATVLLWRGRWAEADAELDRILVHADEQPMTAAMAMVLRASLRRRQGRLDDAFAELSVAEREPFRHSVRHLVLSTRSQLELAAGAHQAAADLAERYLRVVSSDDRIERIDTLDVLARARVELGDLDAAERAASELQDIAGMLGTHGVTGTARVVRGLVQAARGDVDAARASLEEGVELLDEAGLPYELVEARLDLARLLLGSGDVEAARHEAELAREGARVLDAPHLAADADRVLGQLRSDGAPMGEFTGREIDVLRRMAEGQSNAEIAEDLVLSVRTVERHVSNIYLKVGATGPAARTTAVAHARRVGVL